MEKLTNCNYIENDKTVSIEAENGHLIAIADTEEITYVNAVTIPKSRYEAVHNNLSIIAESDIPEEPLIEPVEEDIDYETAYNELTEVLDNDAE